MYVIPRSSNSLARLGEVDDRAAEPLGELEGQAARDRDPRDDVVERPLPTPPGPAQLDRGEVLRERADRRADRHLVVVEDDEHLRPAVADVVERLEREPAHERGVADDDRDPFQPVALVAGSGQPLPDREARARVSAVEHVVGRLAPAWEAADAAELAKRPEALVAAGEELVGIGLVTRIPDDPVPGGVEQPMERDRELHDAQGRPEMAAGAGNGGDDRLADLGGELHELRLAQATEIGRSLECGEDGHLATCSCGTALAGPPFAGLPDDERPPRFVMLEAFRASTTDRPPGAVSLPPLGRLLFVEDVERLQRPARALDEPLDPQLSVRKQPRAALVECDPALVERE